MDDLVKKQKALKLKAISVKVTVDQHTTNPLDEVEVEENLEIVANLRKDGNAISNDIIPFCTSDAEITQHQLNYEDIENMLYKIKITLMNIKKTFATSSQPSSSSATADIKLPKLDLPTFNGNFQQWTSFHDLFKSTIHDNVKLSGAQKLQYLKASLKDEAALLLQSMQITDANYAEAWDILSKRYQNQREIVKSHLKKLFKQQAITTESSDGLRKILDITTECIRSLKILNLPVEHWDTIILFIVNEKLDPESRKQWELSLKNDDLPTWDMFSSFIDQRARALSAASSASNKSKNHSSSSKTQANSNKTTAVHIGATKNTVKCIICESSHYINQCETFLKLSLTDRAALVKEKLLCFNCLHKGHSVADCKGGSCKTCNKKHHSLLHRPPEKPQQSEEKVEATTSIAATHCSSENSACTQVLLSTIQVILVDKCGEKHKLRALLDNGSQSSFITEKSVQRLGLNRKKTDVPITGISATGVGHSNSIVKCNAFSHWDEKTYLEFQPLVLPKITSMLPNCKLDTTEWDHITGIQLADPTFANPGQIDILFGADVYDEIVTGTKIKGENGKPSVWQTIFGWILLGKSTNTPASSIKTHLAHCDVNSTLQKFWELEEIPTTNKNYSAEEQDCENHFTTTHSRDENGRYHVRLPFKTNEKKLGNSRIQAVKRLQYLERRLANKPEVKQQYNDVLQEYLDLGHMELIPSQEINKSDNECYYMPHHSVMKQSSTTALRVVFDASALTSTGVSLNEKLMVGPKIQDDLLQILIRFRLHPICLTADIAKMYRQFKVSQEDADFQRIVFRKTPEEPIKDYRLLTATFGTASAPFLAIRCVQQLAQDEQSSFPAAAEVLLRDLYVDDLMTGANTTEEALHLQKELLQVMEKGKLELRKWVSNDETLLSSLPEQLRGTKQPLRLDSDETIKTLGMHWNPSTDCFSYKVVLPQANNDEESPPPGNSAASTPHLDQRGAVETEGKGECAKGFQIHPSKFKIHVTKRTLLSEMAKTFDPIGFLSPITILPKILFQDVWKAKCEWDDALPPDILKQWITYRSELKCIEKINIPRCVLFSTNIPIQICGFCDASEKAYSAVIYVRSVSTDGEVKVELVTAKTKVAPVKLEDITKLELCGAALLSRLIESLQLTLLKEIVIERIVCFSDSTVTLAWLNSPPRRWKTFVANRVSQVQNIVPASKWFHVSGKENPADCSSRGISPASLKNHPLWWHGPQWLQESGLEIQIPTQAPIEISHLALLQERKKIIVTHVRNEIPLLQKYSSLSKLKRITAMCKRFIFNARIKDVDLRREGTITVSELQEALMHWIRVIQDNEFQSDIAQLKAKKPLHRKSKILSLGPFLDKTGILRVGGRLKKSSCSPDRKHPILLPKKSNLTELIIDHYHKTHLHAGPQLLLAVLQQKYWILGGKDIVRRHVLKCVVCHRHRAVVGQQMMADLPATRVNAARPFLKCGVDYAGPFLIRRNIGRATRQTKVPVEDKAYICLFVCFTTRALHLELVSSLTTEAFLAALKRFVSRRGKCSDIYSDCGTNFVGANNELHEFLKFTNNLKKNDQISNFLAEDGINWHFSPPASPHFGGLWEAGVKSVKFHLKRVIGNAKLNFEMMTTLLTQIEACLNSRPLTAMSTDPGDLSVLTPGHFLIGDTLTAIPEPTYTETKQNRLSIWEQTQQLYQHFWKRWAAEYLSRLQNRPKWCKKSENIKIGDIVLLKEDNLPPMKWKLGRVTELHPGKDGLVRVATIKTSDSILKRSIVKLSILPFDNDDKVFLSITKH